MSNRIAVVQETSASLKAQMLRQLRLLGEATSDGWERAVFQALTGGTREDVDWDHQENYAGYALWLQTFGVLVAELITEGAVVREERDGRIVMFARPAEQVS
jgi:hypothetical protein